MLFQAVLVSMLILNVHFHLLWMHASVVVFMSGIANHLFLEWAHKYSVDGDWWLWYLFSKYSAQRCVEYLAIGLPYKITAFSNYFCIFRILLILLRQFEKIFPVINP